VEDLLEEFGIADLGDRYITELSGGQQQLAAIAQAVAREPAVLLLDEPNTNLDLHRQLEICSRIRELTSARAISTALTVHDVNMAARIADVIYVLEEGRIRCSGTPAEVLTESMIASVYGVSARVSYDDDGCPLVTPIGLLQHASREIGVEEKST
jgi:iron complex transport system ATP-binding protein